ncbi:MAG TPA: transposase [Arthrobacter sp.]|nr:transposase [Arthrobacter sp.]
MLRVPGLRIRGEVLGSGLQARLPHRAMVERSIAWLTRGNRRIPHRGITRNNAWLNLRIAGLNLRRLLALGLTMNEGSWALG